MTYFKGSILILVQKKSSCNHRVKEDFVLELSIQNITKSYYKTNIILNNVTLNITAGITGLIGPNGAGKTTLMKIITTLLKPSSGKVLWKGVDMSKDPDSLRNVLGYLPQDFGVYPNLTAKEFLHYLAVLKGIQRKDIDSRINEVLDIVNLLEVRNKKLGIFSGGMKQRIGIAQALLNDPELLIVDEPTVGLDPGERLSFTNLITDLSSDRIVIFSTHIVSDIETTAGDIVLLDHGICLMHKDPEALLKPLSNKVWSITTSPSELDTIKSSFVTSHVSRKGDTLQVRIISKEKPFDDAISQQPNLEEAYLYYINKNKE